MRAFDRSFGCYFLAPAVLTGGLALALSTSIGGCTTDPLLGSADREIEFSDENMPAPIDAASEPTPPEVSDAAPTPPEPPDAAPTVPEVPDEVPFHQGPLEVTEATGCAPTFEAIETPADNMKGDRDRIPERCVGNGALTLKRRVYVAKLGRDNHVSRPGREFDNDAIESTCISAPALCTSSQYHGYGRVFEVKVTCDRDAQQNPTAKFDTSLGDANSFPRTETGHTHLGNGYACAKSTGFAGEPVSAACRSQGLSTISPQQVVAGAAAGNVFQELYVAYAATHCGRGLFVNVPDFTCASPEIAAEAKGFGFKFTAKNQTYSGKKKVTCTASCGAAEPTLDCKETEDGDL